MTDTQVSENAKNASEKVSTPELIDAINQVFALFRVNYHNQYYSAFSDTQLLNQTKKLWLESLQSFSNSQILKAARKAIEESDYLPTLHKMITYCRGDFQSFGLPSPHAAYVEACNAGNPKNAQHWSHPAVYFAGKEAGWYFLASSSEHMAFPVFKEAYQAICEKVMHGEKLPDIQQPKLEQQPSHPLSKQENKQRLQLLREELDL